MSVTTITIKVDDSGGVTSLGVDGALPSAASAGAAAGSAAEAPAPTLMGGAGEAFAGEAGDGGEGPPPMDPGALGLSISSEAQADTSAPPPEDLVEGGESDDSESIEPMPIEDLDETTTKSTRSAKKT